MPTYLTPGTYIEEVPSANKPLSWAAPTSVAGFVGLAPGGPVNTPMRISNWVQFAKIFGDPNEPDNGPFMDGAYLAHSVYGYFLNGGNVCWVVRVGNNDTYYGPVPRAALPTAADASVEAFSAVALQPGLDQITVEIAAEPTDEADADTTYSVRITAGSETEEFTGLSLRRGRSNLATKINAQSKLIKLEVTGASPPAALRDPATGVFKLSPPPIPPSNVTPLDFEGDVERRRGMGGLLAVDEITMLVMPDIMSLASVDGDDVYLRDLQGKMIAHCEYAGDRMAILDAPPDLLPQEVLEWRMNSAGYDSKFAALYYPWIEVMDPLTNRPVMAPPSGHIAGVWARNDSRRGIHNAPANEVVLGANGLGFQVTNAEQGGLNKVGINCVRAFPGRGIRVWGARTLSSDPEWRYIHHRRLVAYISSSLLGTLQWATYEPHDPSLWIQLRVSVASFLTRLWRSGALLGSSPEQAFYVSCDETLNGPEEVAAGQVVLEVGLALVRPAEFVICRLSHFGADPTEGAL